MLQVLQVEEKDSPLISLSHMRRAITSWMSKFRDEVSSITDVSGICSMRRELFVEMSSWRNSILSISSAHLTDEDDGVS